MSTAVKHHSPGFLALVDEAKKRVHEIGIEEYKRLRSAGEAGQLVDVREDHEWDAAHAAGAMHLSRGIIERDIEATFPDKDAKLVLYCGGGYRSALATDNLQKMGYTNVISLDGGWRAIEASGLPLERAK
ncbi:MAG TPA: rhodanese-like domain-containing protein [Bryobacteraceae bacterium]|jgi:rhodanese-related sulfurtransferase|nr:rhodanese-like domain-containing protein [Bryobacteraceae bacterium]